MICPRCHTNNRDTARFCDGCGYELPTVAPVAREIFPDGNILLDGSTAVTIDLDGLEHMVGEGHTTHGTASFSDNRYEEGFDEVYYASATRPLGFDERPYSEHARGDYGYESAPYDSVHPDQASKTVQIPVLDEVMEDQARTYYAHTSTSSTTSTQTTGKIFRDDTVKKHAGPLSGPKKKRLIIGIIIAALALIAGALIATYALQLWGGKAVPNVIGARMESAEKTITDAGFTADVVYVKSDEIEGIVLSTSPDAGARVAEGSTVIINVSTARIIPDVVGLPLDQALELLKEEGLENIEQKTEKSNEAAGTVLSITPEAGTRSKATAQITIVSAEPFTVPDVVGQNTENAATLLEAEGYTVAVKYTYTEDVAEGTVVSSDPAAGSELPSGSEVSIFVAKSRSAEVVNLTRTYLNNKKTFTMGSVSYEMTSIESVEYKGDNTCSFVIVARPFETHSWFGKETETRYGNNETIKGTITWNDRNEIAAIDPAIR